MSWEMTITNRRSEVVKQNQLPEISCSLWVNMSQNHESTVSHITIKKLVVSIINCCDANRWASFDSLVTVIQRRVTVKWPVKMSNAKPPSIRHMDVRFPTLIKVMESRKLKPIVPSRPNNEIVSKREADSVSIICLAFSTILKFIKRWSRRAYLWEYFLGSMPCCLQLPTPSATQA